MLARVYEYCHLFKNPTGHKFYDMLDPHARPPNFIRQFYKRIQKTKASSIVSSNNKEICDFIFAKEHALEHFFEKEESLDVQEIADVFTKFLHHDSEGFVNDRRKGCGKRRPVEKTEEPIFRIEELQLKVYESKELPGMR